MAEISVKVGKKGDEAAADKSKIVQGKKPSEGGQVEGQYAYAATVSCWNCWALNDIITDTNFAVWFYCWNCGAYNEY